MLDRLAFLPLNLVQESMEMLKMNIPVGAENIVEYFSANDVESNGKLYLIKIDSIYDK